MKIFIILINIQIHKVTIPAAGVPDSKVKNEISDKPTALTELHDKKTLIDINLNTLKSLNLVILISLLVIRTSYLKK